MIPTDRRYTKTHEWLQWDDDAAVLGITDQAQKQLGDITFAEFPEINKRFAAGEACMTVESVKAASDIYIPVAGTIAEVNSALEEKPELLNQDAFGAGWLLKIKDFDPSGAEALMDAAAYAAMLRDEA